MRSVVIDSRSFAIDSSTLFAAIRTESRDGHDYLLDAYNKGCRAFLVEHEVDCSKFEGAGFVVVEGSTEALQRLAEDYRAGFEGCMVAVTGSAGKTVVKEWIAGAAPEGVKVNIKVEN